jgi:hypothetical protein
VLLASCERNEDVTSNPSNTGSGGVLKVKDNPAAIPVGEPIARRKLDQTIIQKLLIHWQKISILHQKN